MRVWAGALRFGAGDFASSARRGAASAAEVRSADQVNGSGFGVVSSFVAAEMLFALAYKQGSCASAEEPCAMRPATGWKKSGDGLRLARHAPRVACYAPRDMDRRESLGLMGTLLGLLAFTKESRATTARAP